MAFTATLCFAAVCAALLGMTATMLWAVLSAADMPAPKGQAHAERIDMPRTGADGAGARAGGGDGGGDGLLLRGAAGALRPGEDESDRRFRAEFRHLFMPSAEVLDDPLVEELKDSLQMLATGDYL